MQISVYQISSSFFVVLVAILVIHKAPTCRAHLLRDLSFWRSFHPGGGDNSLGDGPFYQQEPTLTLADNDEQALMYDPMDNNSYDSDIGRVPHMYASEAGMHDAITMHGENSIPAKRTWRTVMTGERGGYYKRSSPNGLMQLPKRTWRTTMRGEGGAYYKRSSLPNSFREYF